MKDDDFKLRRFKAFWKKYKSNHHVFNSFSKLKEWFINTSPDNRDLKPYIIFPHDPICHRNVVWTMEEVKSEFNTRKERLKASATKASEKTTWSLNQ